MWVFMGFCGFSWVFVGSCGFSWVLVRSFVILNVVKNLSERIDVGAIVDGCALPEILRFAQDDIGVGSRGFSRIFCEFL